MTTTENNSKDRKFYNESYLQRVSAEQKKYVEASVYSRIVENNPIDTDLQTDGLLERILTNDNLNEAYKQVKRNKGAGGVDGIQVDELLTYLRENQGQLLQKLRVGKYTPIKYQCYKKVCK